MENVKFKENNLTVIKIFYSLKNRVPYYIISEFFSFIGTFICDNVIDCSIDDIPENETMPTLCLSLEIPRKTNKNICYIDISTFPWKDVTLGNCSLEVLGGVNKEGKPIAFIPIVEYLKQVGVEFPEDIYYELWQIFIKNNTSRALVNLKFYKGRYDDIHSESENILTSTLDSLYFYGSNNPQVENHFLYNYVELYLKNKTNLTRYYQGDDSTPLKYSVSKLYKKCLELIKNYPSKANLQVLLAMITEKSHGGYNIAFNAYKTALKILGNSSCTSSYINYRLGLLDEQNNFLYQAKHCYANAYKLHKDYHVLFRIAVMFENDLNYQGMIRFLKSCKQFLKPYLIEGMNPSEMEYYYKSCLLLCTRSQEYQIDFHQSIGFGEEALLFYDEIILNKTFYVKLYGEKDADFFMKAFIPKLDTKKVYAALALAYRKDNNMEKSEYYRYLL